MKKRNRDDESMKDGVRDSTHTMNPFQARARRRSKTPLNPEEYIPFREKVRTFFSKNALILTLIVIVLITGFFSRDLLMNTMNNIGRHAVSSGEPLYESALYRDVFLPMSEMVIKGEDFEAFLIANNKLKRADWHISFSNTPSQTSIYIRPQKNVGNDNASVNIRVPIKATPYAFHEIEFNCGPGKNISIERYPSGNIYYFAEDKEKPLSGIQALDEIVKSWR